MAGARARVTAGALAALAAAGGLAACGGGSRRGSDGGSPPPRAPRVTAPAGATRLALGAPGRAVPRGFLGLSIEFQAIRAYTGGDPRAIDPVFEALVRGLSPGQAPVVRIGGDSTDASWVPGAGVRPPWFAGYTYPLTAGWLATTAAFAHQVHARMTLGLDLAARQPALAGAEARAFAAAFGRGSIAALEIGNEPNLYDKIAEFLLAGGAKVKARAAGYGPAQWRREIDAVTAALPAADPGWTLAGPALAAGEKALGAGAWTRRMGALLAAEPAVRTLTVHRYPLKRCFTGPRSPQYPTIAHLLSQYSTTGLADGVKLWVRTAAAHGDRVRVDELNSVACRGKAGVSDTFASALWATDVLFSLASAGVAGVNVHTLPGSFYAPFTFSESGGRWSAHVLPEYYGLALFAQAAPAGSRLVAVTGASHSTSLSAWATRAASGATRLVLIDKHPGRPRTVVVAPPAGTRTATVERMTAPGVAATGGVTLGGRTFGARTRTGRLAAMRTTIAPRTKAGNVVVRVPGAGAALVTFSR